MKVIFPIKLYRKLRAYVDGTELEISGMAEVSKKYEDGDTILTVTDVRIFKQKVSSANTVLDRRDLGKFYNDVVKEGKSMKDWRIWWHSHNRMGAFFSGTDTATIEGFNLESPEDNWIVALVTNHQEDTLIRCDVFEPVRTAIHQVELEIDYGDKEIKDNAEKEIKEKVQTNFWDRFSEGVMKMIPGVEYEEESELEEPHSAYSHEENKK